MEFKHDANIKASLGHTRTRDVTLMLDSEALNPVSGKSHSKEILWARPVWTEYSTAHARYMAPPKNQPITPTEIVGCSSRQAS